MAYPVLARDPQGRILKEIKVIVIYTLAKCNILKFRNREKTDGVEFCLFVCLFVVVCLFVLLGVFLLVFCFGGGGR